MTKKQVDESQGSPRLSWITFQPSEGIHPTSPSRAGHPRHRPWGRFSSGWRAAPHNLSVKPQTYPSRLSSWWLAYFASEFYPKSRSCSLNPKSDPLTGTHTSCSVHPMLRVPALSRLHAFRVPAAPGAKGMPGLSGSPLWNRKPTSSCGQWWSRRWPSRSWREGLGASALTPGLLQRISTVRDGHGPRLAQNSCPGRAGTSKRLRAPQGGTTQEPRPAASACPSQETPAVEL